MLFPVIAADLSPLTGHGLRRDTHDHCHEEKGPANGPRATGHHSTSAVGLPASARRRLLRVGKVPVERRFDRLKRLIGKPLVGGVVDADGEAEALGKPGCGEIGKAHPGIGA